MLQFSHINIIFTRHCWQANLPFIDLFLQHPLVFIKFFTKLNLAISHNNISLLMFSTDRSHLVVACGEYLLFLSNSYPTTNNILWLASFQSFRQCRLVSIMSTVHPSNYHLVSLEPLIHIKYFNKCVNNKQIDETGGFT